MFQLFAADMDGTLLGTDHLISPRTANAIHALQAAGIEFMIATGRDHHSATHLTHLAGIHCSMINLNGAAIYNDKDQLVLSQPLENTSLQGLIKSLHQYQLDYSLMAEDYFYVEDVTTFYDRIASFTGQSHDTTGAQLMDQFGNIKSLDQWRQKPSPIYKIMVMSTKHSLLHQFRDEWTQDPMIDITSSGSDNLEITHHLAQKGIALQHYVESKGYQLDQVVTIGDSLNDRSMLKLTPHSYAMSNASDQVKAMAQHIAPTNGEDGVAQVIEEILAQLEK